MIEEPKLRIKRVMEEYDLRNGFVLAYHENEGCVKLGILKQGVVYFGWIKKKYEEAEFIRGLDLPQNITAVLSSDVFSPSAQRRLRESGLVKESEIPYLK